MRRLALLLLLIMLPLSDALCAATEARWLTSGLQPETLISDLAYLNDPPAGRHGFLRVDGERFVFADGKEARFWGIALSAGACFPDKRDAPLIAARLASLGFNLVRLHHLDAPWAGRGLIDYKQGDSRHFDHDNWDRLDFFINQLKQVGIYVFLDLLVTREFRDGDGIRDAAKLPHGGKGTSIFDPHLVKLQKEYAHKLWTHRNPYNGLRYLEDPVFALTLITNENDLTSHFFLLPDHTPDHPALGQAFLDRLDRFAEQNGFNRARTRRVWETAEGRQATTSMMIAYFDDMRSYLRSIGVRVPVTGTNWAINLHDLPALATMDFMDQHIYAEGGINHAEFATSPLQEVASLQRSAFARLRGKPFVVSEWNKDYPARFRGEYPLAFAAVAAAQGWNAAILYAYAHDSWTMPYLQHPFDVIIDPARLPLLPAAALLYRRAVQPFRDSAVIGFSKEQIYRDSLAPEQITALVTGLWQKRLSVTWQGSGNSVPPKQSWLPPGARRSVSPDGQLLWDWQAGYRVIDTPQAQAMMGWGEGKTIRSSDVAWTIDNHFAASALVAVDAAKLPLTQSGRLLLLFATEAANSGAAYPEVNGEAPILSQAPTGEVKLHHGAEALDVRYLTAAAKWQDGGRLKPDAKGWFTLKLAPETGALVYELAAVASGRIRNVSADGAK